MCNYMLGETVKCKYCDMVFDGSRIEYVIVHGDSLAICPDCHSSDLLLIDSDEFLMEED